MPSLSRHAGGQADGAGGEIGPQLVDQAAVDLQDLDVDLHLALALVDLGQEALDVGQGVVIGADDQGVEVGVLLDQQLLVAEHRLHDLAGVLGLDVGEVECLDAAQVEGLFLGEDIGIDDDGRGVQHAVLGAGDQAQDLDDLVEARVLDLQAVQEIAEVLVEDEIDVERLAQALEDVGDRRVFQAQADLLVLFDVKRQGRDDRRRGRLFLPGFSPGQAQFHLILQMGVAGEYAESQLVLKGRGLLVVGPDSFASLAQMEQIAVEFRPEKHQIDFLIGGIAFLFLLEDSDGPDRNSRP